MFEKQLSSIETLRTSWTNAPHRVKSSTTARKQGKDTAFLSRQGLVLLPHHTASGHLGLWLRRREYYSKSAFEMTSRYKEIKQNFTISLDTQVAPLQGVVSVQESTLAHTFLYTHRRKYFPQLRLMFVKQNDVLCYSMISRSEEKSLYTNRSSVLF